MFFRKPSENATIGRLGETYAADYLVRQGYEILEKNYRRQYGEVDIIASDRGTVVFIEVKTRRSSLYGSPHEAVDQRKQRQLSRIAQEYLVSRRLQDAVARFDVLGVTLDQQNRPVKVELIKDAFDYVG
jgi:putative endonuclease